MSQARTPRAASIERAARIYESSHWGVEATKLIDVPDPLLPDTLPVMGELVALILCEDKRDRHNEDKHWEIGFPRGNWLAFSMDRTQLYNVITPKKRARLRADFWTMGERSDVPVYSMGEVVRAAGGRAARAWEQRAPVGLHSVRVRVLGYCVAVVYRTAKGERDDRAEYIHEMGTEPASSLLPYLGIDAQGRVHWCGGNYFVKDAGICG